MKKQIILLTIFYISFLMLATSVSSKSYSYGYINIFLDFFPNGTVLVRQERSYNFQGSFSYAYLELLKKGAEGIKFLEIRDLDTNSVIKPIIDEDQEKIKATWFYSAENQVKNFLIVYEIDGAVKKYEDVAHIFVGGD